MCAARISPLQVLHPWKSFTFGSPSPLEVLHHLKHFTSLPRDLHYSLHSRRRVFKDTAVQQRLISEIFALVSARPPSSCNFLPLPPLLAVSAPSRTPHAEQNDAPSLVTYRHYATLFFIVISTSTESPLALLDLIQVFVEALDRLFENVCELDLIFNFETLHAVLGEMIVGGVVIETGLDKVVEGVRSQGRVAKRPVNADGKSGMLGQGIWAGR
nr:ap-3 complex subunit sigma [Quercus suber]